MKKGSRPRAGPFQTTLVGPNLVARSIGGQYPGVEWKVPLTGICLYAGGDLTSAHFVKKGYILAQDSLEVELSNTLGGSLSGVDPNTHVDESGEKHANAYEEQTVFQDDIAGMGGSLRSRTNVCQVGCVLGSNMTEASCSLLDLGSRRWIIRVAVLDGNGEIDKVLGKIAK
jgi:hypothetical protein